MASPRASERIILGLVIAFAIAVLAYRAKSLSRSGVVAATLVGTAATAAGWPWSILLVTYFVASSLLSRFRVDEKEQRMGGMVAKGGARDAWQVLANGGVFAVAAAGSAVVAPALAPALAAAAVGALAAATADTWATEIGVLVGGVPRSLVGLRRVPPGTSGAVSFAGCVAMVTGALFIAVVARAAQLGTRIIPVVLAGIAGAFADSVAGATLQQRRWCASCEKETERGLHDCGATTTHASGVTLMDNDVVNLLATVVGGVLASASVLVLGTEWH